MDTTSGNRAIAELMGWKSYTYSNLPNKLHKGDEGKPLDQFNYHSDWNQLMPVVEHIESLGFASVIEKLAWKTSVIHRVWFISLEGKQKEVAGARDEDKKTAIWLAVVALIQWYQEKK